MFRNIIIAVVRAPMANHSAVVQQDHQYFCQGCLNKQVSNLNFQMSYLPFGRRGNTQCSCYHSTNLVVLIIMICIILENHMGMMPQFALMMCLLGNKCHGSFHSKQSYQFAVQGQTVLCQTNKSFFKAQAFEFYKILHLADGKQKDGGKEKGAY